MTKIHLLTDEMGLPVDFLVTAGQVTTALRRWLCSEIAWPTGCRPTRATTARRFSTTSRPWDQWPSCRPNRTGSYGAATIKTSIDNATASNAASSASNTSAASPHGTKNSNQLQRTRRSRLLLASPSAICRYCLRLTRFPEGRSDYKIQELVLGVTAHSPAMDL
jgi:hypothetical protein